jgi:hypothetical protein
VLGQKQTKILVPKMRNLRRIRQEGFSAGAEITASCWDAGTDEVLITHGPTESKSEIELVRVSGYATSQALSVWPDAKQSSTLADLPVGHQRR